LKRSSFYFLSVVVAIRLVKTPRCSDPLVTSLVAMKGRVACEMVQNELIITELILRTILTNLQPAEIAALRSSLVFQAKTDVEPIVTENLKKMLQVFVDKDIRQANMKYNVGYEWARNKPFAEIMQLTDIKEGVIVRCIQQLHETLRDVKDAAKIIGDSVLHSKMEEEASNAIKRDIVFAVSLYTSSDALTITAYFCKIQFYSIE
jgi:antiviral helicase SKI2